MWLFFAQYKKMIALCTIPIIAVVTLIGFEVIHGQDNRSEPLAVNKEMRALLARNTEETAIPAPPKVKSVEKVEAPLESLQPKVSDSASELATQKEDSKTRVKPQQTAKPKATAKSKVTLKTNFKVNVNKAMTEELMKLSGIGESKAKAIIAYRDNHSFQTLDELMKVKGIGPKIFEKIKDHLEL